MTTITIDLDTISEDDAIRAYHALANQFGWGGTLFTREDAQSSWNEYYDQEGDLTDEQWAEIQDSYYWRRGLSDLLTEHGWELVHNAVGELPREEKASA
jgi:hypothetical protein